MASTPEKTRQSPVTKSSNHRGCISQWYHHQFAHQKRLATMLEHPLCHFIITILVVVECTAVIIEILLDTVKYQYKCNVHLHSPETVSEAYLHRLKLGMEICHYLSLTILAIFVIEIFIKIYAFGSHFWNCRANRFLDYLDAVLILVSFSVEIYFLIKDKESVLAHSAMLLVVLRLWHIARIANAAVRCFEQGEQYEEYRRKHPAKKFSESLLIPASIQAILHLMQEKTEYLRCDESMDQTIVQRWEEIDQECQNIFEEHYGNEPKLLDELQKLHPIMKNVQENKYSPITL